MHSKTGNSSRGQGALEYLFLLAGGIIIVIIILLSVIGLTPLGESILGNNVQEYEKIDLCTGKTADCALNTDWVAGLLTSPAGIQLQSTTWRDLYIDQFGLDLQCYKNGTFSSCIGDDFFSGLVPSLALILPVASPPANNCTNVNTLNPGTPIYECSYCDTSSGSCALSPTTSFCPNGLLGPCTVPLTTLPGMGIHIPAAGQPNASQEVSFGIAGDITGRGHSKRGTFYFHAQQIKKDNPSCVSTPAAPCSYSFKPGTAGTYTSPQLNYFVSWKAYTGSFQVCRNLNNPGINPAIPHPYYGCDVSLGGDVDYLLCNYDPAYPLPGPNNPGQSLAYYGDPLNQHSDLGNNQGEVVQLDVTPLAISPALPPLPPIVSLQVANFSSMPYSGNGNSSCWNYTSGSPAQNVTNAQSSCTALCNTVASTLNTSNLDFFRINPSLTTAQWCDALANPIAANATALSPVSSSPPSSVIYTDNQGDPIGASCGVQFAVPTFSGISNPGHYYIGFRRKASSSAAVPKVYSTLRSHSATVTNEYDRGINVGAFSVQP